MDIFKDVQKMEAYPKTGKKAIMEIFSLNVGKPLHI
jgi:hypothetical protein